MMLASMALAAAGMATVPWLSSMLSLNVCFAALGVPLGFVDTGRWGSEWGPVDMGDAATQAGGKGEMWKLYCLLVP